MKLLGVALGSVLGAAVLFGAPRRAGAVIVERVVAVIGERPVLWTELVGLSQFRHYFPTSTIREERLAGLIKSLIAVRA